LSAKFFFGLRCRRQLPDSGETGGLGDLPFSVFLDVEASILQFWRDYVDSLPAGEHRPETPASVFAFGDSKELADQLATLVLRGIKTATCSAFWSYEEEQKSLPQKGEY
jgi:hypothetical protein